jgi:hypothetical protein
MIKNGYLGSRFNATDIPLIDGAWQVADQAVESGQADLVMDVMSGDHYRRQMSPWAQ